MLIGSALKVLVIDGNNIRVSIIEAGLHDSGHPM